MNQNNEQLNQPQEFINFTEIINKVIHYKKFIASITLLFAFLGFLISLQIDPNYKSTAYIKNATFKSIDNEIIEVQDFSEIINKFYNDNLIRTLSNKESLVKNIDDISIQQENSLLKVIVNSNSNINNLDQINLIFEYVQKNNTNIFNLITEKEIKDKELKIINLKRLNNLIELQKINLDKISYNDAEVLFAKNTFDKDQLKNQIEMDQNNKELDFLKNRKLAKTSLLPKIETTSTTMSQTVIVIICAIIGLFLGVFMVIFNNLIKTYKDG